MSNGGTGSKNGGIIAAVASAVLYALTAPVSKLLMGDISPGIMAALLYLGAGTGIMLVRLVRCLAGISGSEQSFTKKELPLLVLTAFFDIIAPICLMKGISMTTAANAALISNFEMAATSLFALLLFGEAVSPRLWTAIALITLSSALLSFEGIGTFSFSSGSLFVLAGACCYGLTNSFTSRLSDKDPLQFVSRNSLVVGAGALAVSLAGGESLCGLNASNIIPALLLGFVAYGLSIVLYVRAQRALGAARTGAFYALNPFIGGLLSFLIFRDRLTLQFALAFVIMIIGTVLALPPRKNSRKNTAASPQT